MWPNILPTALVLSDLSPREPGPATRGITWPGNPVETIRLREMALENDTKCCKFLLGEAESGIIVYSDFEKAQEADGQPSTLMHSFSLHGG